MLEVVSVATMRKSDAAAIAGGIPSRKLMACAGKGVFESYPWQGRTAVVCGSGNNAGDGFVLAMLLHRAGIACRILLLSDRFSEDGAYYFGECEKNGIPVEHVTERPDFSGDAEIADCIFGTGFRGDVSGLEKEVIQAVNESGKPVISVDINSGMNGDSGMGETAVRSALTVSIGSYKTGHFLGRAKDLIGALVNIDIGIPIVGETCRLVEAKDLAGVIPMRKQCSHKGDYGYVGIMGGCAEYSGAAKLANLSCAALRAGCGVATLIVPESIAGSVAPYLLESTLARIPDENGKMRCEPQAILPILSRVKALSVGMGWGSAPQYREILSLILQNFKGSLILDADGLNTLATMEGNPLQNASCRVLVTPHRKEFERISKRTAEEIGRDPVGCAEQWARENGACVLLKGPCTVVTDGKETLLVDRGCAGMATAGSGDVLSGILTGLLGYLPVTPMTAACGAYLAGLAGELAERASNPISMTAGDTVAKIGEAVGSLLEKKDSQSQ